MINCCLTYQEPWFTGICFGWIKEHTDYQPLRRVNDVNYALISFSPNSPLLNPIHNSPGKGDLVSGAESLYTKKGEELLCKAREVLTASDSTLQQYEVLLSCEETTASPKPVAGELNSPKLPPVAVPPPPGVSKGSPESVYSGRVEDEESDQMSEGEHFNSSGQKNRYDSACMEEEGQAGHTLFEDLMDSEDESDWDLRRASSGRVHAQCVQSM